MAEKDGSTAMCSACNKSWDSVFKLEEGPKFTICDACIAVCVDIVGEARVADASRKPRLADGPHGTCRL